MPLLLDDVRQRNGQHTIGYTGLPTKRTQSSNVDKHKPVPEDSITPEAGFDESVDDLQCHVSTKNL